MPPTPIHGTKAESEAAHMHRCEHAEGGPVFGVKAEMQEMRRKVDKLRLQQAAAGGVLALLTVLGPVVLAWWLSTRLPAPSQHRASEPASLFNQAHAEVKGVSP